MLEYIKSVIRSFFSSPSTIVLIEPIVEEEVVEPKVKKAVKKPSRHKPRARKKGAGRKPIYPYRSTPVGAGFKMKNQMNGDIYRQLQEEGIFYSQHKVRGGVLAFRTA
jgi:hypothetical protein